MCFSFFPEISGWTFSMARYRAVFYLLMARGSCRGLPVYGAFSCRELVVGGTLFMPCTTDFSARHHFLPCTVSVRSLSVCLFSTARSPCRALTRFRSRHSFLPWIASIGPFPLSALYGTLLCRIQYTSRPPSLPCSVPVSKDYFLLQAPLMMFF